MDKQMNYRKSSHLLNIYQTAQRLSISKGTLYRLIDKRKIRFYKIGGSLKFRLEDIEEYIDSCCIEAIG